MNKDSRIFVAGHRGLVGSAIIRNLTARGYNNLITRTHRELDLISQSAVQEFFKAVQPEFVILAAARVGGIMANNIYRARFIYENLQIQNNVIHESYVNGVKKLLFLGSSCVYPKASPQPMKEEYLLSSALEYTNEPYAIAKIAGMKMCEAYNLQHGTNFISVMPTNLYGYNDNYHLDNSHVLPALIRKMHLGKLLMANSFGGIRADFTKYGASDIDETATDTEIVAYLAQRGIHRETRLPEGDVVIDLWGTGSPLREFLWSDDMADACVFLMENSNFSDLAGGKVVPGVQIRNTHINIGTGQEIRIFDLAALIKKVVGFGGTLRFDASRPDGTPRKLLDVSKLNSLGWSAQMSLSDGISAVYAAY